MIKVYDLSNNHWNNHLYLFSFFHSDDFLDLFLTILIPFQMKLSEFFLKNIILQQKSHERVVLRFLLLFIAKKEKFIFLDGSLVVA